MADQQKKIIGTKGYGGKLKNGETWQKCSEREIGEQSGKEKNQRAHKEQNGGIVFDPKDLIPFAVIDFYNGTEAEVPFGKPSCRVIFSKCFTFSGTAIETCEMRNPKFYWVSRLPYKKMITGDIHFITSQTLLGDICVHGWIRQTADLKKCIKKRLRRCSKEALTL